jgi:hypothetical protein
LVARTQEVEIVMKLLGVAVCMLGAMGCAARSTSAPKADGRGGVKVDAPGVKVNVDSDGKTDVKAPGVEVETGPKKTTKSN